MWIKLLFFFSPALCHAYGLILLNTEASRERAQCLKKVSISFEHCREETPDTFEMLIRYELNKCEHYYFLIGEGISEVWMVCGLVWFVVLFFPLKEFVPGVASTVGLQQVVLGITFKYCCYCFFSRVNQISQQVQIPSIVLWEELFVTWGRGLLGVILSSLLDFCP